MTADKINHQVPLSTALTKRIIAMAKARHCSKTELLAEMIEGYANRRSADQPDERMFAKLDLIQRVTTRSNYETTLISYCLSRFVRHQLIYAAALPPPSEQARAIGEKRYQQFLDTVAKLVARDTFNAEEELKTEAAQASSASSRRSQGSDYTGQRPTDQRDPGLISSGLVEDHLPGKVTNIKGGPLGHSR